jgi:hypothetical protein
MPTEPRQVLLKSLLERVCLSVRWSTHPTGDIEQRLTEAFRALELRVAVNHGELIASVDDEMTLRIRVKAARWSTALESALEQGVRRSGSVLAELVLLDWSEVQRGGRGGSRDEGGWISTLEDAKRRSRR